MSTQVQADHDRARALAMGLRTIQDSADPALIAETLGYEVNERPLARIFRGKIAHRLRGLEIVLNSEWPWENDAERCWVIAHELGHLLLGHQETANRAGIGRPDSFWSSLEEEADVFADTLLGYHPPDNPTPAQRAFVRGE